MLTIIIVIFVIMFIVMLPFAFVKVAISKSKECPSCNKKIKMVTNSVRCPFCKVKFIKNQNGEYQVKS